MASIISVKDVSKVFNKKVAVNHISFEVNENSIFGFLGTNGAGKSTTIKMITGLLCPTSGSIEVCGLNPEKEQKRLAQKIGIVPEKMSLYEDMTVFENLKFFGALYNIDTKHINDVINLFGISKYKSFKIRKLSKGYKQRVLIARALLHNPKLLFMDEPTSGLDPNMAYDMRNIIRNLNKEGHTIFLTTHNMNEAEELCDNVVIIKDGKIIENTSIEQLRKNVDDKNILVKTGVKTKLVNMNELKEMIRNNEDVSVVKVIEETLENVFVHTTRE